CWQENRHYRQLIFGSALGEVGAGLMRSAAARLYHDHMLTKEPGTRQRTPWHQDQPYYNISGEQNCSFWIPVDPVGRESTLEFVAGSHRGPWLMPRYLRDAQARCFRKAVSPIFRISMPIEAATKSWDGHWNPVMPFAFTCSPSMPPAGWAQTIAAASTRCGSSAT